MRSLQQQDYCYGGPPRDPDLDQVLHVEIGALGLFLTKIMSDHCCSFRMRVLRLWQDAGVSSNASAPSCALLQRNHF